MIEFAEETFDLKSKEKILGYYASLEKAILGYKEELVNKVCLKRNKMLSIEEVIEFLLQIENCLNHVISTLKSQD